MRAVAIILFSIVFWNMENYFDYFDGGTSDSDKEFSSRGARHWNKKKFNAKTSLAGKTILWSDIPDIAGFAEIENKFVLNRLIYSDILRKCEYSCIHFESPDPRGIDVALIYRKTRFELLKSYPVRIAEFPTRDILYARLKELSSGEIWHIFVNHHPSKYGGKESEPKRKVVMESLICSIDSLRHAGETNIVAMGDFNDGPNGPAFELCEGKMNNLGLGISGANIGTIRYHGNWELIDNFLVSDAMKRKMRMEILQPPFLLERDKQYPGNKPKRTYVGPRYNGGVSDHLPIRLTTVDE